MAKSAHRITQELDNQHIKILFHIARDSSADNISDWIDLTTPRIYERAKKLKELGLVERPETSNRFFDYRPTGEGWEVLYKTNLPPISELQPESKYIRGHYFTFTFELTMVPDDWYFKREIILKSNDVNYEIGKKKNNFEYIYRRQGDKIILGPSTVRVQIKEVFGEDPEQVKWKAIERAVKHISNVEQRFDINCVKTPKMASFKCNTQHLSRVRDELAKWFVKNDITFKVFDENDELIFVVDQSKSTPEFEAVHPKKAMENLDNYKEFIRKIGEEDITAQDIEENREDLDLFKESLERTQEMTSDNRSKLFRTFKNTRENRDMVEKIQTDKNLMKTVLGNQQNLMDDMYQSHQKQIKEVRQSHQEQIERLEDNHHRIIEAIAEMRKPFYEKFWEGVRNLGSKIKEKLF